MNILYVHGFGSDFDPSSDKVMALEELGKVHGVSLDWTKPVEVTLMQIVEAVESLDIDLIVGTSMGGWAAANVGAELGIPFVAINPAVDPAKSLMRYTGERIDFCRRMYNLTEETVREYFPMTREGYGLIMLDLGDKIIDSQETINSYEEFHQIVIFEGGSHRFDHIASGVEYIKEFYNRASTTYGFADI